MPRQDIRRVIAAYRKYGLTVQVVPGAETRGDPVFNPGGHVGHHTAGAKTGDRPSLQLCVDGRADLAGPLCQDFLARSGWVYLVACGRAHHAGLGSFRGILGNSGVSGTEAEDDGDGLWTPEQLWAYPRVVAARLDLLGRDASWYCSHRTWAEQPPSWPGRKVDPAGIADDWMRGQVAALQANPNPTGKVPDMLDATDRQYIAGQIGALADALDRHMATLLRGDPTHPVNLTALANGLGQLRTDFAGAVAGEAARDAALAIAVDALDSAGGAVDLDQLAATMRGAAEAGASAALSRMRLDVSVADPEPAPPAGLGAV